MAHLEHADLRAGYRSESERAQGGAQSPRVFGRGLRRPQEVAARPARRPQPRNGRRRRKRHPARLPNYRRNRHSGGDSEQVRHLEAGRGQEFQEEASQVAEAGGIDRHRRRGRLLVRFPRHRRDRGRRLGAHQCGPRAVSVRKLLAECAGLARRGAPIHGFFADGVPGVVTRVYADQEGPALPPQGEERRRGGRRRRQEGEGPSEEEKVS
mmetsp:Transcript_8012/g.19789  ORF Transcript_8012/g.19789 Transcript_8012/m.19789 type:complete len:210 (-) Transcript_8012:90-719(-)